MHTLEHWSVVIYKNDAQPQVVGLIIGHPEIPDGLMTTSFLKRVDEAKHLVHTRNSIYNLGAKNPAFERWLHENGVSCPDGFKYEHDLQSLPKLPLLTEMHKDGISDSQSLSEKWLTKDDWKEITPGVPMDFLSTSQGLRVRHALLSRVALRMREAFEERPE